MTGNLLVRHTDRTNTVSICPIESTCDLSVSRKQPRVDEKYGQQYFRVGVSRISCRSE